MTGGGYGDGDRGQEFARFKRGEIGALVELSCGDFACAGRAFEPVARAQGHHQRRHVVAGIAIGDIAADGAAVAYLGIGDQKYGFVQNGQRFADLVGRQQFVLGGHRADHDRVAVAADALEAGDAMQVDQMLRAREPELHHRHQAVAAGQRAGLVTQGREQFHRVGHASPAGDS